MGVDVDRAVALYGQGLTLAQVGNVLGVSSNTVLKAFRQAGVATRRPGRVPAEVPTQLILDLYDNGLTMPEVAARVGLSAAGAWSRYRTARPPKKPEPRLGRWQHVLLAALKHQDAVSVRSAVNVHLGREPSRAELHAARRAAHSLADNQLVRLEHIPGSITELGAARHVLVIIRPGTTSGDGRIGRHSAAAVAAGQPVLTAPDSQARTVQRLRRAAHEVARLARAVDTNTLDTTTAANLHNDITAANDEFARLNQKLQRRRLA